MLYTDLNTNERVYELICSCGSKGGEIRFPENHGRDSDEALKAELDSIYTHRCEEH